jgi:hypothetical protein
MNTPPPEPEGARSRIALAAEALFVLAVLAAVFVYSFRPNWDIDIFWHIATGRWISDNLALPRTDLFSATDPSRPWHTFQWLYEVLVYQVEARAGFVWVRLLHTGLFVAAFALWWRTFRQTIPGRVAAAFLLILALVLSGDRFRVRPEVFNFFFAALTLPALLGWGEVDGRPRRRTLALVGVVAAFWANIHAGGALWLVMSAAAVACGRFVAWLADPADRDVRRRLGGSLMLAAAATLPMLPMPGFVVGVVTAFTMYEGSMALIPEWHPPAAYFQASMAGNLTFHHVVCGLVPYLVLAGVGALVIAGLLRHTWRGFVRRTDPGLVALAGLMALLAAHTARFIYLDALALAALAVAYRGRLAASLSSVGVKLGVLVATMALAGVSYQKSIVVDRHGLTRAVSGMANDLEPDTFPVAASDTIAAMGLQGRILQFASWGGYLIGRHWPDCTVFSDGRGNFTDDERLVIEETGAPYRRAEALEAAWRKYPFDIVVFPPPVFPLLTWDRADWMLIHRDATAEVFLRLSPGNATNLQRALAWWRAVGLDVPDAPADAERDYLAVLSEQHLRREDVHLSLENAAARAESEDPRTATAGSFEVAMILFDSGRYDLAATYFRKSLDSGFRHSTSGLYLAWSLFLDGDVARARTALVDTVLAPDLQSRRDFGPLRFKGRKILDLLSARLGFSSTPPAPPSPAPPP